MSVAAIKSEQRLVKVLDYIENNLQSTLDLSVLSEVSHWSRWQLQRVFKQHTGLSVAQYVRQLRLSQSASYLIGSKARNIDIALTSGFESEISFTRTFRAHFGCTPKEYRRGGVLRGIRFPLTDTQLHSIRLEQRDTFQLQGLKQERRGIFFAGNDQIGDPLLWQQVRSLLAARDDILYSRPLAILDTSRKDNKYMQYWVGVEAIDQNTIPEGLQVLQIPEQLYAVITHRGPWYELQQTVNWFIAHWLMYSPYQVKLGFECEEHIKSDDKEGNYHFEYWVPIEVANELQQISYQPNIMH